MTIAVAL